MMNKLKYLMKLRKQNDSVKLIVLLALAGMISTGFVLYHAGMIYRYMNTPVEYVLTADQTVSAEKVRTLLQMKGITRVSRQLDIPVTIWYQGVEVEMPAVVLSQEYVEGMVDRTLPSGIGRIFMNDAAFSGFRQEWSDNREGMELMESGQAVDGGTEWEVRYGIAEAVPEEGDGEERINPEDRSARIMVCENGMPEEEPLVCLVDTDGRLAREACSLRVQYESHDLDGLHVKQLTKLGYVIENEEMILGEEYEIKIILLHIRYGLIIAGICLIGVSAWGKLYCQDRFKNGIIET